MFNVNAVLFTSLVKASLSLESLPEERAILFSRLLPEWWESEGYQMTMIAVKAVKLRGENFQRKVDYKKKVGRTTRT